MYICGICISLIFVFLSISCINIIQPMSHAILPFTNLFIAKRNQRFFVEESLTEETEPMIQGTGRTHKWSATKLAFRCSRKAAISK